MKQIIYTLHISASLFCKGRACNVLLPDQVDCADEWIILSKSSSLLLVGVFIYMSFQSGVDYFSILDGLSLEYLKFSTGA